MHDSSEMFIKKIRSYNFINGNYTLFINQFPKLELELTEQQLLRLNGQPIKDLIFKAEHVANMQHPINAGIIGATKLQIYDNIFIIQGSQAVIELVLDEVFG